MSPEFIEALFEHIISGGGDSDNPIFPIADPLNVLLHPVKDVSRRGISSFLRFLVEFLNLLPSLRGR